MPTDPTSTIITAFSSTLDNLEALMVENEGGQRAVAEAAETDRVRHRVCRPLLHLK